MTVVAAFLWNKSPSPYISTLIFDSETLEIISPPTIHYLMMSYLKFRTATKKIVTDFFNLLDKHAGQPVTIEYRIVFEAFDIPYLKPAKESKYVFSYFFYQVYKSKKKNKYLKVAPQLRARLSGRALKLFKRELQSLHMVSRKRNTGYQYHLWAIALHATKKTYADKLKVIRRKLEEAMWNSH